METQYFVARGDTGPWFIVDQDGYSVTYVTYDTKREALEALRTLKWEVAREAKRNAR